MKLLDSMFLLQQFSAGFKSVHSIMWLNPNHAIYKAHFPGQPITPGVCIVTILTELFCMWIRVRLNVYKVNNLKFVAPLSPVTTKCVFIEFEYEALDEQTYKIRGTLSDHETGQVLTKYSITYTKQTAD